MRCSRTDVCSKKTRPGSQIVLVDILKDYSTKPTIFPPIMGTSLQFVFLNTQAICLVKTRQMACVFTLILTPIIHSENNIIVI